MTEARFDNLMSFETFKDWAIDNVRNNFPEEYDGSNVEIIQLKTRGTTHTAMKVMKPNSVSGPAFNLDQLYEAYTDGTPLNEIGDYFLDISNKTSKSIDPEILDSYENMKDKLFIRVCNTRENRDLLDDVPHTEVEDLSITYHVAVDMSDSFSSLMLTNNIIDDLGISKSQLHHDAVENSQNVLPAKIRTIQEVVSWLPSPDMDSVNLKGPNPMLVISNDYFMNGAAALFYPEMMEEIGRVMGGNYYVLPSSIHEVIAIPEDARSNYRELESMVREINEMTVAKEDQLSNRVYHYDDKEHSFALAAKHKNREMER